MGYKLQQAFAALHDFLSSTIHSAGPWAVPAVIAVAVLIGLGNQNRLVSGFGVFLVLATAALVTLVIAFQTGRV